MCITDNDQLCSAGGTYCSKGTAYVPTTHYTSNTGIYIRVHVQIDRQASIRAQFSVFLKADRGKISGSKKVVS